MSRLLRLILCFVSITLTGYIIKRIRQSKLQIEYTLFWLFLCVMLIILSVFPEFVYKGTQLLGMMSPINMVFIVMIFLLLLKVFFMTLELSQLENKVKELVQKIALDEKERLDGDDEAEQEI